MEKSFPSLPSAVPAPVALSAYRPTREFVSVSFYAHRTQCKPVASLSPVTSRSHSSRSRPLVHLQFPPFSFLFASNGKLCQSKVHTPKPGWRQLRLVATAPEQWFSGLTGAAAAALAAWLLSNKGEEWIQKVTKWVKLKRSEWNVAVAVPLFYRLAFTTSSTDNFCVIYLD